MAEAPVKIEDMKIEDTPTSSLSSYQVLMEGLCEVKVNAPEKTDSLCITELLRDLYAKHYQLVKIVAGCVSDQGDKKND